MARDKSAPRINILDPLRGLAALAVCWYHFSNGSPFVKTEWLRASGHYGYLGVDVFFVISGFVIPYSMYCGGYRLRRHFFLFMGKRMARLEPPYLASIVLVLVLWHLSALSPGFAGSQPNISATQLLLHLGYLNTFFGYQWLNPVYWSLGIEFQYYIFVALVYPLLTAQRAAVRWLTLAILAALSVIVNTSMLVFPFLSLFLFGILAFQLHAKLISRPSFLLAVAGIIGVNVFKMNWVTGALGATTALVIAFVPMPRHRFFRVLVFLGGISYSLYLLHTTIGGRVVNLGTRYDGGLGWELAVLFMAFAVSIGAAYVFNRLIERPAQWLSSRIKYG